jgi:hypothetical protein
MKLKLKKLEKLHQEATKGPYRWAKDGCLRAKDGTIMMDEHDGEKSAIKDGNFIKASYENLPALISWAKRARPWIQKAYSQKEKEREVIEDLYGVEEPYLSGLAEEIAELEQLLGEVEP